MGRVYTLEGAAPNGVAIDFASELNEQQLAAATHLGSPALVIAGAGSGKTRTLIYRVHHPVARPTLTQRISGKQSVEPVVGMLRSKLGFCRGHCQ